MDEFTLLQLKNKILFVSLQDALLELINTQEARYLLGIREKEKIISVFPNGWKFYLGSDSKKHYFQYDFFCYEKAAKFLLPILAKTDLLDYKPNFSREFLHFSISEKNKFWPQLMHFVDTDYYAGAGDGYVSYTGSGGWATTHDAADGTAADATATTILIRAVLVPAVEYQIRRGFFPIDTSGITDTDTIDAAVLKLYVTAKSDENTDADWRRIVAVQTSQASTSTLGTADYDQCGAISNPTEGSNRLLLSDVTISAYNNLTLDATGLTWVSVTGFTKLGVRVVYDTTNNSVATGNSGITCSSSENTGTSQDPLLTVSTTAAGAGAKTLAALGVG